MPAGVPRTIAFVDLCGFTAFMECNGDTVAAAVLTRLRSTLRDLAAGEGVRVAKWLGDGAMLSSIGTDELVVVLMEIRRRLNEEIPELAVRAGLAAGRVIMFEGDDYVGRPVNVASRLCDQACPRQVLGTASVIDHLPLWVSATPQPQVRLKGLVEPIELVSLEPTPASHAVIAPHPGLDEGLVGDAGTSARG